MIRRPWPRIIGARDWFHQPPERFIRFYTQPPITVYMLKDDAEDYAPSCCYRIHEVLLAGGYATRDSG
jgi:hypothetical protein